MTNVDERFAEAAAAEYFGVVASVRALPGDFDKNFLLTTARGEGYILKISHPEIPGIQIEFENALMAHLKGAPISQLLPTLSGDWVAELDSGLRARLRTRLPGKMLVDVQPHTKALLYDIGQVLGRLDKDLNNFSHPAMHRNLSWDLTRAAAVIRDNLDALEDDIRQTVLHFLKRFEKHVAPFLAALPAQVIHNDANDYNLLVTSEQTPTGIRQWVSGLVDFGDALFAPRICEPAIAAAYVVLHQKKPLDAAVHVVLGYHNAYRLTGNELALIWDLMCARLSVSVSIASRRVQANGENAYHQVTRPMAVRTLQNLNNIDPAKALDKFQAACSS